MSFKNLHRQSLSEAGSERPDWFKRVGWLALIWVASVAALLVVALGFRFVMGWVGLTV